MDDHQVTESLKKILMAGFGAVSTGMEKSQEVLDKLAEKGESAYQSAVAAGKETADKLKQVYEQSGIKELFNEGLTFNKEDLLTMAEALSLQDILWLQNQLAALAMAKASSDQSETASDDAEKDEPTEGV